MKFERDAVRYSEDWRLAFSDYLTTMLQSFDLLQKYSPDALAELAIKFADKEFGIDQKEEAP